MPRKEGSKPVEVDRSPRSYGGVGLLAVGLLLVGGTIFWARSDTGMIDVSATIANSQANRNTEAGVDDNAPAFPAQVPPEYASKPNGGLQAQGGDVSRPPEPEPVPTETGTSTASTTDDISENAEGDTTSPETTSTTPESTDTSADTETTTPGEGESGGEAG